SMMTLAFAQLDAGDTLGRIVLAHTRHGRSQQRADGLKPMALGEGSLDLPQHFQDVVTLQERDAFVAVLYAEALDDAAARLAGFLLQLVQPSIRLVVGDDERIDRAR